MENDGDSVSGGVPGERESEGYSGGGGEGSSAALACNRWPHGETSAMLNIRLEMDPAFRDASVKAPLWDELSRRLAQLGFYRSAANCKVKFESLRQYHRRIKQQRWARSNPKAYRFFEQLEALDHQLSPPPPPPPCSGPAMEKNSAPSIQFPMLNSVSDADVSTSSSDEECGGSRKMKRKWQDFFRCIMNSVLQKQEDLHRKFLEALDRSDQERIEREQAWKKQELARLKREQELLEQERLIAAAKDAAVISFLQKISQESSVGLCDGEEKSHSTHSGTSRWPKEEVHALIKVRTDMELSYQGVGDGPKGLWEEISASMKKLGYDRNSKRCKEKWENINKYYRRVKESNKNRPVDSKTCSYFHQLETLYNIKSQKVAADNNSLDNSLTPEELLMHMMNHHHQRERPHQQRRFILDQTPDGGDHDNDDGEDYEEANQQFGAHGTSTRSILA